VSRIGKKPVEIPDAVKIKFQEDNTVLIEGPKGKLSHKVPESIKIAIEDKTLSVICSSEEKNIRALHGLTRSLLANMVEGVTKGFEKILVIKGVGYRARKSGNKILLSIGYSHTVEILPVPGIELDIEGTDKMIVRGIDKVLVGQMAANIKSIRPPDPYKQKGIMYQGERLKKKMGKAGKVGK
jgi:large subunit ribosomal protein L6